MFKLWRLISLLLLCALLGACQSAAVPTPTALQGDPPSATVQPLSKRTRWPTAAPTPTLAPNPADCVADGAFPPLLPGLRYGVNPFLLAGDSERALTLITTAGFGWVRQQIHWRDIESAPGAYSWVVVDRMVTAVRARGLRLMLSVVRSPAWATAGGTSGLPDDPATFARFMAALAERYRGRVAAYEVWNEPNLAHENGGVPAQPATYLATLRAAYPAIKQADPCALVLAAPLAATATQDRQAAVPDLPFYEELYQLDDGAFLRLADIVAVHPGGGPHPPDASWPPGDPDQSAFYFRHIERIRDIMVRHGDRRQVWITEVGWTVTGATGAPQPVSEQQQADYLRSMLHLVRTRYAWVSGVFIWNLNFSLIVPPGDEKATFSILAPDWAPRPAYLALQAELNAIRDDDARAAPRFSEGAGYSLGWSFKADSKVRTRPLLTPEGDLYVASDAGYLYAFSAAGGLRWIHRVPGGTISAPLRGADGTLYLGDLDGHVSAISADGRPLWVTRLSGPAVGSPVLRDGRIFIATSRGVVHALSQGGRERWSYKLGAEATPVAADDEALYVGTLSGGMVSLDFDGKLRWSVALGRELRRAPVPSGTGGVYMTSEKGTLFALGPDGQPRWSRELDAASVAPPLLAGDRLYLVLRDGSVAALAAEDGGLHWRSHTGADMVATPALAPNGDLLIGTDNNTLIAMDQRGALRWRVDLYGMARSQPAVDAAGSIYVTTVGGRVYKLVPRD